MRDINDWSDFIDEAEANRRAPTNGTGAPPAFNGVATATGYDWSRERSYALAGLRRECDILAAMPPDSGRNNQLNNAVYSLSGFVPQTLSEEEVVDNLGAAALASGLPLGEAQATIRSALRGSKAKGVVRAAPPREPDWFSQVAMSNLATPPVVAPTSSVSQFFGTAPVIDPGASTANENANAGAEPDDSPDSGALGLEAIEGDFWESRESLALIYSAALSRLSSPWAVLAFCAARALTLVPPRWTLPPIIGGRGSLNWFAALATKSGGGKDSASAVARELVPQAVYERNLGSGEGMLAAFERPKNDDAGGGVREAVMFSSSEVDQMTALGGRTGSTLMSTLREAFTGSTLGFSYVSKSVQLPAHTYRLTYVCGVQPARAGGLLGDSAGGTPQRFMWFPALDRRISREFLRTDPWMPTLEIPTNTEFFYDREIGIPEEAADFIINARVDAARGEGDPLDSHAIFAREKFAYALAVLDGRVEMTLEDWELSGIAAAVSRRTRNWVTDHMTDAQRGEARERGEMKGVEHVATERSKALESLAPARVLQVVVNRMIKVGGDTGGTGGDGFTKKQLRDAAGRDKRYLNDALTLGLASNTIRQEGTRWFVC